MTITTTRRGFLGLLGLGTAAAVLAEPLIVEPVRRFWQVGSNAPVGDRIERVTEMPQELLARAGRDSSEAFEQYIANLMRNSKRAFDRQLESALIYGQPSGALFGIDAAASIDWKATRFTPETLTGSALADGKS